MGSSASSVKQTKSEVGPDVVFFWSASDFSPHGEASHSEYAAILDSRLFLDAIDHREQMTSGVGTFLT
jgi:hypothetical protein